MEKSRQKCADYLLNFVDSVNTEFNRDLSIRADNPKEWLLAQTLLCLFNSGSEQTRAVALCVSKGYASSARTCLRGLVEINLDVRLMLDYNDPFENAARYLIVSAFELKKYIQKDDRPSIAQIDKRLNGYKSLYPGVFSEIENKILANKIIKHWSGLSYKKKMESIKGTKFNSLDMLYGYLSWDTHSRMAVHHSKFEQKGNKLSVQSLDDDNLDSFENIINLTGPIYQSLANAIFYSPVVIEKSTGKNLVRPDR